MTENETLLVDKAKEALHLVMDAGDNESARVSAARTILTHLAPTKEDAEEQKRAAEEHDAAVAEARGLLADFAAAKLDFFRLRNEVAEACKTGTDHAVRKLARLVDHGGTGLGQDANGG